MMITVIIHQIDEVIRDTCTSRQKKIENLQNLAMTCWQEVVPEYGNPETYQNLESAEVQKLGQKSVVRSGNMRQNPKFCMFLTGPLLMVISTG